MTFFQAIRSGFIRWLDVSGRSPRSEYWYFSYLFPFVLAFTVGLALGMAGFYMGQILGYTWGPVARAFEYAIWVPSALAGISIAVRRLHDTDRRGWWLLLNLIPLIGQIVLFIFYITRGTTGKNRFGEDPLKDDIVIRHHFAWMRKFSFLHCMLLVFLLVTAYEARTWFIQDHPRPVMENLSRFFVIPVSEQITAKTNVLPRPIEMAVRRGDNAQVLRALENGMSLDARNNADQRHLLHYAARYGNLPLIKILLAKGVDINIPDADNSTPLHYAAYTPKNVATVKYLLSKGAKWDITDKEGYTPLGYAKMAADPAMIAVLTAAENKK